MRVAILLLNSGRGSGEVARQQARYLASSGCQFFFMHADIGDGAPGAVNINIELHTAIIPVHEHLPSAGNNQEQVAAMSYARAMAYLPNYERALASVVDEVDIVLGASCEYQRDRHGEYCYPRRQTLRALSPENR